MIASRRSVRRLRPQGLRTALGPACAALVTSMHGWGCSSAPTLDVEVTSGQESGALALDPRVVRIDIDASTPEGAHVKASAAPGDTFDLGEVPDDKLLTFDLSGVDANENVIARGRSIAVLPGSLKDGQLPLFIERLGGWSRPGGALAVSHVRGATAVLAERYLVLTGGDSALDANGSQDTKNVDFYDLLALGPAQAGALLPRVARTIVMRSTRALLIGDDGATWADLLAGTSNDIDPPSGLAFADVAGGQAIDTASGVTYVVGATRRNMPTAAVLVVGTDGALTTRTLTAPRAGAAAAYVPNVGLVVVGGSADAPGVEILPDGDTPGTSLPFPNDATIGAALVPPAASGKAVVAGGTIGADPSPTRAIDLGCYPNCAFEPVDGALVDSVVAQTRGFSITGGLIVVGDDASGETRAFDVQLAPAAVTELPFREPRRGASAVPAPNGTLAVLGGELVSGGPATSVEILFPE